MLCADNRKVNALQETISGFGMVPERKISFLTSFINNSQGAVTACLKSTDVKTNGAVLVVSRHTTSDSNKKFPLTATGYSLMIPVNVPLPVWNLRLAACLQFG